MPPRHEYGVDPDAPDAPAGVDPDAPACGRRLKVLRIWGARVVTRQPDFWVGYLEYLKERRSVMRDTVAAE